MHKQIILKKEKNTDRCTEKIRCQKRKAEIKRYKRKIMKEITSRELNASFEKYLQDVAESFGEPYDDRKTRSSRQPSLREVAAEWGISLQKARQLLITAGVYSTELSRNIQDLTERGISDGEIMDQLEISQSTLYSYRPYARRSYGGEITEHGKEAKKYRERKKAVEAFAASTEKSNLNNVLKVFAGYRFTDAENHRFKYEMTDNGIIIDGKEISIDELWAAYLSKNYGDRIGVIIKKVSSSNDN